jgi:hypothetical protein
VVQVQIADTLDGVVVLPLLSGTVTAGREEAMQHGKEDGPFDGKLEAPVCEQGCHDLLDRAVPPESLEDQTWPDPGAVRGDAVAPRMGAEDGEFFGKPTEQPDQRVEPAAGQQLIQAAETKHDTLLNLAVHPLVIHDEQISPGTVGLRANEQIAILCHYHGSTQKR